MWGQQNAGHEALVTSKSAWPSLIFFLTLMYDRDHLVNYFHVKRNYLLHVTPIVLSWAQQVASMIII